MPRFVAFSLVLGSLALAACAADADPGASEDDVKKSGTLGSTCGGIAGLTCNPALHCEIKFQHPDASGKCAAGADVGGPCGGIAGFTCRSGLTCNKANHPDAMGKCEAPSEVMLEGELTQVAGIGGESTGFAIDDKKAGMTELVLDAKEKRAFVEGRVARVRGKQTTLNGVESGPRTALEVSRLTVCPAPNASMNCMPPVQPEKTICGEDRDWAEKNCSGIRFLD